MKQAKLIIRDEVNVKIEGLDLNERRALSNRFKYEDPRARYLPSVRLGRWDGKVQFFQLGGSTYVNLLPEIIPYLDEQGYDIELDDQRDYNNTYTFSGVVGNLPTINVVRGGNYKFQVAQNPKQTINYHF